ncbi:MAG TPA: hypothetical protein VMB50_06000 [Myxococcales bacterium]|nr:hypothetical protein [Myxococcales bacterium]
MKKIVFSAFAAAMLLGPATALADRPYPPDCHLEFINQQIDQAMAQIHSSPAWGHAMGHYAKALDSLQHVKRELHEGCKAWNQSMGRAWNGPEWRGR